VLVQCEQRPTACVALLLGHLTAMPPTSLASKEHMDAQLKKALDCSDEEEPPLFGHTSIYVLQ
jgi:hypothetical protein